MIATRFVKSTLGVAFFLNIVQYLYSLRNDWWFIEIKEAGQGNYSIGQFSLFKLGFPLMQPHPDHDFKLLIHRVWSPTNFSHISWTWRCYHAFDRLKKKILILLSVEKEYLIFNEDIDTCRWYKDFFKCKIMCSEWD